MFVVDKEAMRQLVHNLNAVHGAKHDPEALDRLFDHAYPKLIHNLSARRKEQSVQSELPRKPQVAAEAEESRVAETEPG